MRLYLDSADRGALEPLLSTGLFAGVSTNPLILQRGGVRLDDLPQLVDWLLDRCAGEVFVQTTHTAADDILAEGRRLHERSDRLVFKVPADAAGLTAGRILAADGVPVLVTALYSAHQALLAEAAGAAWVAPYLGRIDARGGRGVETVIRIQRILDQTPTRVLTASLKSPQQVADLAAAGVDAFTLPTDIARAMLEEPGTLTAVREFDAAVAELR